MEPKSNTTNMSGGNAQKPLIKNDLDIQKQADLLLQKHMQTQFPESKVNYKRIALIPFLVVFVLMNIVIAIVASKL